MTLPTLLDDLSRDQLSTLVATLTVTLSDKERELHYRQTRIDQLIYEISVLRRYQFGKSSEQRDTTQASLLDDTIDADIAAIEEELEELSANGPAGRERKQPKRASLPPQLPRVDICHEPDNLTCRCGCKLQRIGEDISEKLDYTPGVFSVERHVRGKWSCATCETLIQAPVPAQVIDKGIPTAALLAQVLVAKYADHTPLYRQVSIFGRAGLSLPRSTLGAWVGICGLRLQPLVDALRAEMLREEVLHADETPLPMLNPGNKKTHRGYLWAYASTRFSALRVVVYDFAESRAGEHARNFLGDWNGSLICDDYGGYKKGFQQGILEIGCMAHARRKFFDLHVANKSQIAEQALKFFTALYDIEQEVITLTPEERRQIRMTRAKPIADMLYAWMQNQRQLVPEGSAIAKALDYNLKRWNALVRFLDNGHLPIDNNWIENQIRPVAIGRGNWLFVGSLRAGKRAAAIMSLIQSAKLNGHDPYLYLKDVLTRLPTQKASEIASLLPHRWNPDLPAIS